MFTLSSLRKVVEDNLATVVDGPYGWDKSTRIPEYFAKQEYKIVVAVPDLQREKSSPNYKMVSYDQMIDIVLKNDDEYNLYILDSMDTSLWQIEAIISIWLFKPKIKLLCIGSSVITDELVFMKKAKYVWIDFEQYPIFNIYASKDGSSMADLINILPKNSSNIASHCIIDGRIPRKEIGTCPIVVMRNPRSRYSLSLILSKLGLKDSVTVYYLNTKETIASLPENEVLERNINDKYKIIYAFESRKLPLSSLIFTSIMPIYRLLKNYNINNEERMINLFWDPCSLYILSEMDKRGIGNLGRLTLSLMSTPGLIFNTQGLRDDPYFDLVKDKFVKYKSKTMLEVYLKIAEEFIKKNPVNIEEWANEHSFYPSFIINVVRSYRFIALGKTESKSRKSKGNGLVEFFADCAQRILKVEPLRLLQYNDPMNGYTDINDNLYLAENLIVDDEPILIIYLQQNNKYVTSYIPIA